MTTFANVCPVVGTTNDILPPSHPSLDFSKPDQVCPVTNASINHHSNLHAHPSVSVSDSNTINNESTSYPSASACPALKNMSKEQQAQELDEQVCPVIGLATNVLPPDHPSTEASEEGAVCPVTKATLKHHKGKVVEHPSVNGAAQEAVCPVTGQKGAAHA